MDYATLSARMRERPSFGSAEDVIRRDYPLKLPDRRSISMWNTPEISQFRGYQEELNGDDQRRHVIRVEKEEIHHIAHEANSSDMDFVSGQLDQQRQSQQAMQQHMENMANLQAQHAEGLATEQRAELIRLSNAQQEAANRARIAEEALSGLRDTLLEDRARLGRIAEGQGVVHNHVDQSVVNNIHHDNTSTTQIVDTRIHNEAVTLMQSHASQFGAFMYQQRMNQDQMMHLIQEHLRRQQPAQLNQQLNQLNLTVLPRPELAPIVQYTGGGGDDPPGGAGAVRVKKGTRKQDKAPKAIVVQSKSDDQPPGPGAEAIKVDPEPVLPPQVPIFEMHTRGRTRSAGPRPPRASRAKAKARPQLPWTTGMAPEQAIVPVGPPEGPRPPKRDPEPITEILPPRAKAKAKSRARSAVSVASTVGYDDMARTLPQVTLPVQPPSAATKKAAKNTVKLNNALNASKLAADIGKSEDKPVPKAKAKARARSVPNAGPQTRKPRITKVKIGGGDNSDMILKPYRRNRPRAGRRQKDENLGSD